MSAYGMYTAIGFIQPDEEIEIRVIQHAPDKDVHVNVDRLSFLVSPDVALRLRDALTSVLDQDGEA